jgi:hypothetical protein
MQMKTQNCFDSYLAYMDHSLPPLGLFLQIKLKFLSLSQPHMLRYKESCSNWIWSKISKTPLFPLLSLLPTRDQLLTIRGKQEYFDKQKTLTLLFKKSQVVADPFIALAFFSPPLASSTKTGSILALLTPLPHQNLQLRVKRQEEYKDELGRSYSFIGVQWKSFMVQVHLFPFKTPFETRLSKLKHTVSLKGSSCSTSPPKFVHHLQMDL